MTNTEEARLRNPRDRKRLGAVTEPVDSGLAKQVAAKPEAAACAVASNSIGEDIPDAAWRS